MPYSSFHTAPIPAFVLATDIETFAVGKPYQASKLRLKGFEHAKKDFYEAYPHYVQRIERDAEIPRVKPTEVKELSSKSAIQSGMLNLESLLQALHTAHSSLATINALHDEISTLKKKHASEMTDLARSCEAEKKRLYDQIIDERNVNDTLKRRIAEDDVRIDEQMKRAEEAERDLFSIMTSGQREIDHSESRALRSETELKETKKALDETKAHLKHFVEVASKQSQKAEKYKKSAAEAMSVAKEAHSANVEKRAQIDKLQSKLSKSREAAKLAVEAAQFFQHNVGELQIEPDTDLLSEGTLDRFALNPPSSPQDYENELFEILNRRYSKIGLKVVKHPLKLSESAKKYLE